MGACLPADSGRSGKALDDPPPTGVGGGEFYLDPVTGQDPHRLEAGLSGRVAENLVPVRQLDPVERIGERFDDPPHEWLVSPCHGACRIGLPGSHGR